MAGESAPTLFPSPAPEGGDAFQEIVNQNFDPVFIAGEPAVDPVHNTLDRRLVEERNLSLGTPTTAGEVEHPFGDGFLITLPEAGKRTPTPAPVIRISKNPDGSIQDIETGSPD